MADTVRKFKAAQGSVICQKDGQVQGVGLLMDALKAIPREKTPKEMSEEEISALFSAPAKIPETTSGNKAYQDGWKQLKEHLKLTELDQDDLAETKYAYARRFGELGDADVVASIDKFLKDLPGEHGTSIADLRARARRVNRQTPLGLIVIDYLQLCECRSVDSSGGQLYAVTRISKEIKAMAKELKTPVIALSQLRRPTGAKADESDDGYLRPTTAQLRESGAIEQDADVILLMNRTRNEPIEGEPSGGIVTVINVAKNRNGETGETKAVFDPSHTQFVNRSIVRTLD